LQLNIIAQKMAKKNVLLKKLEIIDELGAATVIAVDKTGTLTRNNTIVTGFWYNRRYMTGR
jgi:P-type E1-E2 ATPase